MNPSGAKSQRTRRRRDLTHRFRVREKDQLAELADSINEFTSVMDKKTGDIKHKIHEVSKLFSEIQSAVSSSPSINKELESMLLDAAKKVSDIEDAINYFKTSKDLEIIHNDINKVAYRASEQSRPRRGGTHAKRRGSGKE